MSDYENGLPRPVWFGAEMRAYYSELASECVLSGLPALARQFLGLRDALDAAPENAIEVAAEALFLQRDWEYQEHVTFASISEDFKANWRERARAVLVALGHP